ncbi:nucleoside deaminase [Austwickia chelonae]|uniref:nucleoside deaminase n=1 Tax=Austwickia chelonae TaxID=100225 RepID=UPI000E25968F|nr:nucleoside deaminase [Austwickia chelonae]
MQAALDLAEAAGQAGDVPIGAVVVDPAGQIIGTGANTREIDHDPTGHAEIVALREAARRRQNWRLDGCTLVVTLEPCPMCAGATSLARIDTVVLGTWDPKAGACGSLWDLVRDRHTLHRVQVVGGVRAEECGQLLLDFFDERR